MVIESRLLPQHAVGAEVHHAVGFGGKRKFFAVAGEPQFPKVVDEIDLAVRLDEQVVAACPLTHAAGSMPMRCIKWSREELVETRHVAYASKDRDLRLLADFQGHRHAIPKLHDRRGHP